MKLLYKLLYLVVFTATVFNNQSNAIDSISDKIIGSETVVNNNIVFTEKHRITNRYFDNKITILRNITPNELATYPSLNTWVNNGSKIPNNVSYNSLSAWIQQCYDDLKKIIDQCEKTENTEDNNQKVNNNREQEIAHTLCYILENITKPIFNINEYMPHYRASFMHDICIFMIYNKSEQFYALQDRIDYIKQCIELQNIPN